MIEATKKMIDNWKNFSGVTNRPDFWWAYLGTFLINMALWFVWAIFWGIAAGVDSSEILWMLAILLTIPVSIISIFFAVAMLAAEVRRLRDAGFPWWIILVAYFTGVGSIALIVFLCLPSTENKVIDSFNAPPTYTTQTPSPVVDVAPEDAPVVESNIWYCPNCGAENTANFCASCGTKKP